MKLICCEMCKLVGIGTVAIETGLTIAEVKSFFTKIGVKPSGNAAYRSYLVYDSATVQTAFEHVKKPLTSSENGV